VRTCGLSNAYVYLNACAHARVRVCDSCTQKGPTDIAEAAVTLGGDKESQESADKDYDELKQSDDINHEVVSSLPCPPLTPAVSVRVYMDI
jgi:hypothetical protein